MIILETVKTEKRSIELINNYLMHINMPFGRLVSGTCRCECGETQSTIYNHRGILLEVGICEACGDDNNGFEIIDEDVY